MRKKNSTGIGRRLAAGVLVAGLGITMLLGTAAVAEETVPEGDFLIEDDGEVTVSREGEALEDVQASEQAAAEQTEPQTESEEQVLQVLITPAETGRLQEYLDNLLQMESPIGSDGELIIASYIESVMEGYGYTISEHAFHEDFINENGVDAPGLNVIAERGADSEKRTNDILIISTHYDSKTNPSENDPLSNDKSGAAVLLEMARILSVEETDTDICFLFLSGEEDGLYGSTRFLESLDEEYRQRIVGVLHVEQVGYGAEAPCVLKTIDGQENALGALVKEAAETVLLLSGERAGVSDGEAAQTEASEPSEKPEEWSYLADEATSQTIFAREGFTALTVTQELPELSVNEEETAGEVGAEAESTAAVTETNADGSPAETELAVISAARTDYTINTAKLQIITDILSEAVYQVMSEQ